MLQSQKKKEFRFKIENTWLKEKTFVRDVTTFWEDLPNTSFLPKLLSVSKYMKKRGHTFFNKFKEKLKAQKRIIEALKIRTDEEGIKQYLIERDKLNEFLLHEETYWKQRAKLFWLREGDDNTKYFHASATMTRKENHISFLEEDDGT